MDGFLMRERVLTSHCSPANARVNNGGVNLDCANSQIMVSCSPSGSVEGGQWKTLFSFQNKYVAAKIAGYCCMGGRGEGGIPKGGRAV